MHVAILLGCASVVIPAVAQTPPQAGVQTGKNLVDVLANDPDLTTLVTFLTAAKLVDALKGQGPFTIWAPTNAAFAQLPRKTLNGLSDPANAKKLQAVLLYHVCPGRVSIKDGTASTLNAGETVTLEVGLGFPITLRVTAFHRRLAGPLLRPRTDMRQRSSAS